MNYLEQARQKLRESTKGLSQKAVVMAPAIQAALLDFCEQDEEFAQAVAQGGSFPECMKAVEKGVGSAISDLDAYKKAVAFYFPGAGIRFTMKIDLCASVGGDGEPAEPEAISLNLEDFL